MATETLLTTNQDTATSQTTSARDLLLHYLKRNGYKISKDDAAAIAEKKEDVLVVTKHSRKEIIDIKSLSEFVPVTGVKEEHHSATEYVLHAVQGMAEALFFSFINFGKYFKGEKLTPALALPDTERYRQIIQNLEHYFTENNLDFKVYLLAENGEVQQKNLNYKKNAGIAVPREVMEKRSALKQP